MKNFSIKLFLVDILILLLTIVSAEEISNKKVIIDNKKDIEDFAIINEENKKRNNSVFDSIIMDNNVNTDDSPFQRGIEMKVINSTKEESIINNTKSVINSLNSPFDNSYAIKHHGFEINFFSSFFRSFFLLFVSEVMDKTFIIILYFSTKLPAIKLLFFSGFSLLFMNSISIIIGYSLPFLLYRTLIEWIALISFVFLSFAYVNEAYHLEDESHEDKIIKTIKNQKRSKILERRTSLKKQKPSKYYIYC